MAEKSELNVNIHITENVFSSTNIEESISSMVVPATVALKNKFVKSGVVSRLTDYGTYSEFNDTYVYIKNNGKMQLDVRSASADAGIFGTLLPNDFIFVRMKKGLDVYVKNLGAGDGKIQMAYWQADKSTPR